VWLLLANLRYWSRVAPLAHSELRAWEHRARAIADRASREVSLDKLRREGFNAEVAATLAVFVPLRYRRQVVKTIVALEVLYDYLDGLVALPQVDPLRHGDALFAAFRDAAEPRRNEDADAPGVCDTAYAEELAAAVRSGLSSLPGAATLRGTLRRALRRTAEGQIYSNAVRLHGRGPLEQWARRSTIGTGLDWPEYAAGAAASVLAVHALIAAAADPRTTDSQAREIDQAYLAVSAISTMLDSVNDYDRDIDTGRPVAIEWYNDSRPAERITSLAWRSLERTAALSYGARHVMIAAGVISYYMSPVAAGDERAQALVRRVRRELRPLIWPSLLIMRTWRTARRLHAWPKPRLVAPLVRARARLRFSS
jgi:hypothetical protein